MLQEQTQSSLLISQLSDKLVSQNTKSEQLKNLAPRLISLTVPYIPKLLIGLLALGMGSGINLIFPYIIRRVLNKELGLEIENDLGWITVSLIILFAVQGIFFYIRHYYFQSVGYSIVADLRNRLFQAILIQDISFFDRSKTGDLLSRLSADTQIVQRALTINISVALRYSLQVIGGIILMCLISLQLTIFIILLIPLLIFSSLIWGKKLRKLSRLMQNELGESNVIAEETLEGIRSVRIFAGIQYEVNRFKAAIDRCLSVGIDRCKLAAAFSSSMVFLMNSAIAIVIYYGGKLVLSGELSIGDLTAFLLYCIIVAVSFGFLVNVWDDFMQAVGASERIFDIIDSTPYIYSPKDAQVIEISSSGSINQEERLNIKFENVSFAYASRPSINVLDSVSFEIPTGKTVAIVGPSGSGKSTIASLILRFYDPSAGTIYIQGIPLQRLSLENLWSNTSVVHQQPQIFSVSIAENIKYSKIDASDSEVIAAAKAANIHNFIESLPEKYNSLIGDRGVQLSGGERQRVAIARALLKNPKLLILDEATSSLDSENEHLVQQALSRLTTGRTTLVIAHRLSTVQHADAVLVLKEGRIIQRGTHQELMSQIGLYKTLVEHQLL